MIPSKTFGLDFDGTFTADMEFMAQCVRLGKARGHRYYCVTARHGNEENAEIINGLFDQFDCQMPIIFCNLGSKLAEVERRGIKIDIWWDDDPTTLVHGH